METARTNGGGASALAEVIVLDDRRADMVRRADQEGRLLRAVPAPPRIWGRVVSTFATAALIVTGLAAWAAITLLAVRHLVVALPVAFALAFALAWPLGARRAGAADDPAVTEPRAIRR